MSGEITARKSGSIGGNSTLRRHGRAHFKSAVESRWEKAKKQNPNAGRIRSLQMVEARLLKRLEALKASNPDKAVNMSLKIAKIQKELEQLKKKPGLLKLFGMR